MFASNAFVRLLSIGGREIQTTAEHPFWVKDKGWTPCNKLEAGDLLASEDGRWLTVGNVRDTGEFIAVYNLRVSSDHTYFVGKATWGFAVWSHNANCVPGSADGKSLVRYGSPDTVERLAADAAAAEAKLGLGHHGVSAMLRKPPKFPHGQADYSEAAKAFDIIQTGENRSHFTVILPKPVTQAVADLFNSIFKPTGL